MAIDPNTPKNIILIGFMGSGKSSIGRELKQVLGYPVIDTDALIVKRAGKPIRRIFEEDGEEAFRDLESEVLRELEAIKPTRRIIATGGGVVVRPENREILRQLGFVVLARGFRRGNHQAHGEEQGTPPPQQ